MSAPGADPLEGLECLTAIDPADYPHRCTLLRADPPDGSHVAFVWQPLPWPLAMTEELIQNLADGGGVVLMARTAGELVPMREVIEAIIAPAPIRSGGHMHRPG